MSMKNFNDAIGNGTRNLPACSAVPQPTALPRANGYSSVMNNRTPKVGQTQKGCIMRSFSESVPSTGYQGDKIQHDKCLACSTH